MDKRRQKPNPVAGDDADSGMCSCLNNISSSELKHLIGMKYFAPYERDEYINLINSRTIEYDTEISISEENKEVKAWYEQDTDDCCARASIIFFIAATYLSPFCDYSYPTFSWFNNTFPVLFFFLFHGLCLYVFLQQCVVSCIFLCLEICNETIFKYALLNLIPILSRVLAYQAAQIHPDPLCHSLFFVSCNGLILYVGFRKPVYAFIGWISVTIGVFFFYMGQGLLYEIPLLLLLVVTPWYKFNFMIYTESYYEKHHRHDDQKSMAILILLLIIVHWRKPMEIWQMIPDEKYMLGF